MPEFSTLQGGVSRTSGATAGASSVSTLLTAHATPGTKGAVTELIAATEFDYNWVMIQFTDVLTGAARYMTDILIGAATEQVMIPDLFAWSKNAGGAYPNYLFPVFIPKGSRIAAQCTSSTASSTIRINITFISGTMLSGGSGPSWVSIYGGVTSQMGTNVDPGGVANTDSSPVEIVAATTRAHNWLVFSGRFGDGAITGVVYWRVQILIGAATEAVLIADLHFSTDGTVDVPFNSVVCLPVFIPSGSRLAVKARCNSITDGDRDININLYGAG